MHAWRSETLAIASHWPKNAIDNNNNNNYYYNNNTYNNTNTIITLYYIKTSATATAAYDNAIYCMLSNFTVYTIQKCACFEKIASRTAQHTHTHTQPNANFKECVCA